MLSTDPYLQGFFACVLAGMKLQWNKYISALMQITSELT